MFGNVMNNKQISAAIEAGIISITPFDKGRLKNIHYSLTPEKILKKSLEDKDGNYSLKTKKDFSNDPSAYVFEPNEFAIVEIEEHIALKENIVGHFIPSSKMVTKGLGLVAGRIEAPFGNFKNRKHMIRLSVKNLTEDAVQLSADEIIAHVYFVDLRGLDNYNATLSQRDEALLDNWTQRRYRAADDGPLPED